MQYLLLLLLISCGKSYTSPEEVATTTDMITVTKPMSCTVVQTTDGATITCPDGTKAKLYNGEGGSQGIAGVNGTSCLVIQTPTGATINCGETSATVTNGENGKDGERGTDGQDAPIIAPISSIVTTGRGVIGQCASGSGVMVTTQTGRDTDFDNILDEIIDVNVTFVCDGVAGQNGVTTTVMTFKPIEIIRPCGNGEILLKLDDTTLIGVYWDKKNSYLTTLGVGTWVTTMGDKDCKFSVNQNYEVE